MSVKTGERKKEKIKRQLERRDEILESKNGKELKEVERERN